MLPLLLSIGLQVPAPDVLEYKATFDPGAATYIPFLGSKAPRNFPVVLRLASVEVGGEPVAFDAAAAPVRTGDTVAYDRGALVELYDLAPRGVEQRFVLDRRPGEGDLVLTIAVETELEGSEEADGIRFSGAYGSVLYGLATAIDARGRTAPAPTRLLGSAIEIRVEETFLDSAAFPLTVDPWITTFHPAGTPSDELAPDVCYDADTGRFLVVFEREFSASDHDVIVRLYDASGTFINTALLDTASIDYWANPAVANIDNNNQWLVVAEVGPSGSRRIRGHTVSPQTFAIGVDVAISPLGAGDCTDPDVGGDPTLASGRTFCVVWDQGTGTTEHNIHARRVAPDGTLQGSVIVVEGSAGVSNRFPRISKHKDSGPGAWSVVWERQNGVWAARIGEDGTIVAPATLIEANAHAPAASSPRSDGTWLLAYRKTGPTGPDVWGRWMSGLTALDTVDLSALIGGGFEARSQEDPAVDADGDSFVLAYTEKYTAGTLTIYDVVAATLRPVGDRLRVSEGHVLLGQTNDPERGARVCTRDSAGNQSVPGPAVAVWQVYTGDEDVDAALYELEDFTSFCFPGEGGVIACPCGNPGIQGRGCNNSSSTGGALLTASGTPDLSNDSLVFHTIGERPTATSIVAQFAAASGTGLVFGQGVRCGTGTLKRLYVKVASGGQITAPSGTDLDVSARSAAVGDPLVAGATRVYLVYYRDPNVQGGCPSTSTFNSTQSGAVTWRP